MKYSNVGILYHDKKNHIYILGFSGLEEIENQPPKQHLAIAVGSWDDDNFKIDNLTPVDGPTYVSFLTPKKGFIFKSGDVTRSFKDSADFANWMANK